MNLKLAEYDLQTGKFKWFLELEEPIQIDEEDRSALFNSRESNGFLLAKDAVIVANIETRQVDLLRKDRTDPLNRFDGLFSGKTFGKGRFVLIENDDYQIFNSSYYYGDRTAYENPDIFMSFNGALCKRFDDNSGFFWGYDFPPLIASECIGNIFESPELYEKIK